jgi:hypothetical protein
LANHRFLSLSNPFGTLFNPVSIANVLKMTFDPELFTESYRHFFNHRWVSFAHHGKFSHPDENKFIHNIHQQWEETKSFLKKSDFLFITFGTAYCYKFIERDIIVSNCHKIPNKQFKKFRLKIDEIVLLFSELQQKLRRWNPALKIIYTVSPVRQLGDGFRENQMSKSILHVAIDQLVDNYNYFYFPAYEVLMDDLRDYRFYAEDMCHVGINAVRYIEEVFANLFFSPTTKEQLKEVEKEIKLLNHRSLQ